MKALSLYQDKGTFVHRLDVISKLLYVLVSIAVPIILPDVRYGVAWLGISLVVLGVGKVLRMVVPLMGFSLLVLLSVVLIQGLFNQNNATVLFKMGQLVFYKEGLGFALGICIRVLNILCAFSILVLTTKTSDLIETLVRRGLSPRLGYVLASVLQIIPQMAATMETILDAQRSRGMETEGNLWVRIKAFIPLIGPVVMNALVSTRERSMALEVRAFNASTPKTFLNEELESPYKGVIQIGLLGVLILAVVGRVFS